MLEILKHWQDRRLAMRKTTDFGTLEVMQEAEIKNREAHDDLMRELRQLQHQLSAQDSRQYRKHLIR